MVSWMVELLEYDIQYIPRGSIKSQALEDVLAEFSLPLDEETPSEWSLSVDHASNVNGSGAGIVLEGPGDMLIE